MGVAGRVAVIAVVLVGVVQAAACQHSQKTAAGTVADHRTDSLTGSLPSPSVLVDSAPPELGWWARLEAFFGIQPDSDADTESYEGHDAEGIPHYATQQFSVEDSLILRRAYGIEDPHRLYLSDSSDTAILKYDTQEKGCRSCLVDSYDVGFMSVRRPDESWEQVEQRVKKTPHRRFTGGPVPTSYSTEDLDPTLRPAFEKMLADAAAAGFKLKIIATYRSPMRQAFLMSLGGNRTHTLTSSHSYGRAVDLIVDDGNRGHKKTKADWIAFRTWLTQYRGPNGEHFETLGALDHTWDWPHIEVPSDRIGFRSIDEAIARGKACLAPGSKIQCDFSPNLPPRLTEQRSGEQRSGG